MNWASMYMLIITMAPTTIQATTVVFPAIFHHPPLFRQFLNEHRYDIEILWRFPTAFSGFGEMS
jgi:hypothetical protein